MAAEKWLYLGVRDNGAGKKVYGWRDVNEAELFFSKAPRHVIVGSLYELPVERKGDTVSVTLSRARFLHQHEDDVIRRTLQAEHRMHLTHLDAVAAASRGALADLDSLTIGELRELMHRQPVARRRALMVLLLERLR